MVMNKAITQGEKCIAEEYKIIGVSKYMRSLRDKINQASINEDHVLITGPTGTGKELVARNIHWNRNKSMDKYIPINCSIIANNLFASEAFGIEKGVASEVTRRDGFIKSAHGGTLFLDEIEALSLENQAKLLRFLDNKMYAPVGVREEIIAKVKIVAATNEDLQLKIKRHEFREDLYYRLAHQIINTEPIAEKTGDIICLVNHFMAKEKIKDVRVKLPLYLYGFPGNVRELKGLVKKNLDEINDVVKRWSDEIDKKKGDKIKKMLEEIEELFEEDLTITGPDYGVNRDDDSYDGWFDDLSKYGFSDENRKILEDVMKNRRAKGLAQIKTKNGGDERQSLAKELFEKRRSAIIKRDYDIIERRLTFYEVAILVQDCECSKDEISHMLHIRTESLSPDIFKEHYHFDYPGKIKYNVKTPLDVFSEPEEEDDD